MKKAFGILALLLALNSCDDGDLTIENVDFQTVTAASCGETIYKIRDNEAMYLKMPTSQNAFINEATPEGTPRVRSIGGEISVTYRTYNGTVSSANICNTPSPVSPAATQEWTAVDGDIEITTTAVYSTPDATTGATKVVRYLHNIVFKNIVFQKPDGQQIYETFNFGEYSTTPTTLPFNLIADDVKLCASGNLLYNARNNGIEGLYIENLDPALLSTDNLGTAKSALISDTANHLVYRLFETAITTTNNEYFCGGSFPDAPVVNEEWIAQPGVSGTSGIIEVTTTTNGTGYLHTIKLKGVTFQKGNNTFYYGNDILYGNLLTN